MKRIQYREPELLNQDVLNSNRKLITPTPLLDARDVNNNNNSNTIQYLQVPDAHNDANINSDSNTSLDFRSESNMAIIFDGPRESRNILQQQTTEDVHKRQVIRLERLKDKSDCYSSHIWFLKECRNTKVIPKGLWIDIEPSNGNNDEDI